MIPEDILKIFEIVERMMMSTFIMIDAFSMCSLIAVFVGNHCPRYLLIMIKIYFFVKWVHSDQCHMLFGSGFFLYRKVHLFLFFLLFKRSTRFDCLILSIFKIYPILHIFLLEVKYVVLLTLVYHPVIYKTRKELSSKLTKRTSKF